MPFALPNRLVALSCVLAVGPLAHGAEHVTLRNGFAYDCVRHEAVDADHVRLYLSADAASTIDLPAAQIALVEVVPDPPLAALPTAALAVAASPTLAPPHDAALALPELLAHAGTTHNIDVELLAAVVHAESGGRTTAVSRTGARGLMQLMPATAADLGVTDPTRADQNINGGTAYLDALLTRYHDNLALALAAYNAGPGAVDRYHGVPPYRETRAYVVRVELEFKRRKLAAQHLAQAFGERAVAAAADVSPLAAAVVPR